jgi:hypothetical protein
LLRQPFHLTVLNNRFITFQHDLFLKRNIFIMAIAFWTGISSKDRLTNKSTSEF